MAKAKRSVKFNRKNDGQEIQLEFIYLAPPTITYVQQMLVEQWVKEYGVTMLAAFKMKFPELVNVEAKT